MPQTDLHQVWTQKAARLLRGRRIVAVRYMSAEEANAHLWDGRAVVLELDNGLAIYPSADDEGNGPGALFTTDQHESVLPRL